MPPCHSMAFRQALLVLGTRRGGKDESCDSNGRQEKIYYWKEKLFYSLLLILPHLVDERTFTCNEKSYQSDKNRVQLFEHAEWCATPQRN